MTRPPGFWPALAVCLLSCALPLCAGAQGEAAGAADDGAAPSAAEHPAAAGGHSLGGWKKTGAHAAQPERVPRDATTVKTEEVEAAAAATAPAPKPVIQNLGDGDSKVSLVDHAGTWSLHAENVATNNIARLWHEAGGPEITVKLPVDRPFTISVHKLSTERIIERMYDGYSYTLHYDDDGRLDTVRVYSPRESAAYKTPRLTETLSDWKVIEAEPEAGAELPAVQAGQPADPEAPVDPAAEPAPE